MGLGALLTRNLVYQATNTVTGEQATYTVITDGRPGMYPDWSYGAYRGLLGIPAADAAMMLIAGLLGRVPWDGYRKVVGRRPVKLDPAPTILEAPAGSFEIPLRTWGNWAMDRIAHGNGVGLVASRSSDGWPTSYLPVSAEMAYVRRASGADVPNGFSTGEIVWAINGRQYHQSEVIHFKGPCRPGELRGWGILENHFRTLERSRKLDEQAGAVDSAAVPTGLLKSLNPDLTQAEATALKDAWNTAQATRSVAVLNPSTEFEPIAWNPTEAQLIEARKYTITEWANIFGIDVSFLNGENPSRVYANLEEKGLDLLRYETPGVLVAEFEQTLTMQLPRGQYVKANLDFTLRAATKTRYEAHSIGIAAGFLTPDEARELEDRDPLTDEQRAQIQQASAKLPAGPSGQQAGAPGAPSTPAQVGSGQRVRAELEVVEVLDRAADLSGDQLHDYWTKGEGLAKWAGSPKPWTTLRKLLSKYLSGDKLDATTSAWYRDVFGHLPGQD
jgi:phage portal protein BeeE